MNGDSDNTRDEDLDVIAPDGDLAGDSDVSLQERIRMLQHSLERWTKEAGDMKEKYIRTAADFDNYRKRMQRDMAEFRKYANEQMAQELLSVVDHLGLALRHAGESSDSGQGLQQGVDLVYKQFCDVLEKFGIKRFSSEKEPFDPIRHDAVMQVVTDAVPENTVMQVMQDGYWYHDKVLRHAKVSVSKKPDAMPTDGGPDSPALTDMEQGAHHGGSAHEDANPETRELHDAGHEDSLTADTSHESGADEEGQHPGSHKKKHRKR